MSRKNQPAKPPETAPESPAAETPENTESPAVTPPADEVTPPDTTDTATTPEDPAPESASESTPDPEPPAPVADPLKKWAESELAKDRPAEAPEGIREKAIAEKVAAGLTRQQAIDVLTAQAEHDA